MNYTYTLENTWIRVGHEQFNRSNSGYMPSLNFMQNNQFGSVWQMLYSHISLAALVTCATLDHMCDVKHINHLLKEVMLSSVGPSVVASI